MICNRFSFDRYESTHRGLGATTTTWLLRVGAFYLKVERSVGVYGLPDTVSHGVRWWRA